MNYKKMKRWGVSGVFIVLVISLAATVYSAQLPDIICYSFYNGELCFNETTSLWSKNNSASYYMGFVGIGTDIPDTQLQVSGGGLCVGSDANCNGDNNNEGVVYSSAASMTTYDLAENFPTKHTLNPGDVVSFDPENPVYVKKTETAYDQLVAGVISTEPGVLLGGFNGKQYAHEIQAEIALAGRVPVKVTTQNGNINVGDRLTSSNTPGYAMKFQIRSAWEARSFSDLRNIIDENENRRNSIIGKALEPCDVSTCKILTLMTLR